MQSFPILFDRVRQGRNGGVWRHVKEVMQGKGQRIMFVDGITSIDDLARVKTHMIQGGVQTPSLKARLTPKDSKYIRLEKGYLDEICCHHRYISNALIYAIK